MANNNKKNKKRELQSIEIMMFCFEALRLCVHVALKSPILIDCRYKTIIK